MLSLFHPVSLEGRFLALQSQNSKNPLLPKRSLTETPITSWKFYRFLSMCNPRRAFHLLVANNLHSVPRHKYRGLRNRG